MLLALACGSSHAQLLRLHVADADLRKNTQISYSPAYDYIGGDYIEPQFDANGNYAFDADMPGQYNWVAVYGPHNVCHVVVERGKTADVTVTRDKKGRAAFTVKDDNKSGGLYLDHLSSGTSTTAITGYGMPEDRVPAKEGLRQLDSTMVQLRKHLAKVKPATLRDFLTRLTDATEAHYRLDIISDHQDNRVYCRFGGSDYDAVCRSIKPDDPVYLRFRLNDRYFYQLMDKADLEGDDLTAYGLKFIAKMREAGVSDPLVRHVVLGRLADLVLCQGHPNDVDAFWQAFTDYAAGDTALTNKYGAQVASLRATRQGNPAIDETFADSAGVSHSFGEYKGKVLYVDLWATWCGPCQKEIPHFAKVAAHYKDDPRVQLISVSMDREKDRATWLAQIRREQPAWPQFILGKAEHDKLSADYGVMFIPRFILIDQKGNLVNADATRPSDPKTYEIIDSLLSPSVTGQAFTLTGRFPGLVEGAKVTVSANGDDRRENIAQGAVSGGAFTLTGHLSKPTVCELRIDDRVPTDDKDYSQDRGITFMADNTVMTVSTACFDSIPLIYEFGGVPMVHEPNVKVTGGRFQKEYQEWRDAVYAKNLAYEQARNRTWQYRFGDGRPDKEHYDKAHEKELSAKEQAAQEAYDKASDDFAAAHPAYAVSLYLTSQRLDQCFRFTTEELDNMLALYKDNGDTTGYNGFKEKIAAYRRYARNTPYTDFYAQTPDGKEVRLKDALKAGQYNVIDFWASWCGPCRASIPLVKAMHQEHPQVNIVSVSCDTKLPDWQKAMQEEQMPWTQLVLSPDKTKTKVARDAYRIRFIPYLIIIDPQGRVAYAANSAEEIVARLKSLK